MAFLTDLLAGIGGGGAGVDPGLVGPTLPGGEGSAGFVGPSLPGQGFGGTQELSLEQEMFEKNQLGKGPLDLASMLTSIASQFLEEEPVSQIITGQTNPNQKRLLSNRGL